MKRKRAISIWALVAILLAALLIIATSSGCQAHLQAMHDKIAKMQKEIADYDKEITAARKLKVDLEEQIINMPPGKERDDLIDLVNVLDGYLLRVLSGLARLKESHKQLQDGLKQAEEDAKNVELNLRKTAEGLPQPWGSLALLGIGLAGGLVRAGCVRNTSRRVIASVQDVLPDLTDEQKKVLDAAQGRSGKRLVDEAQGKKSRLPF